MELFIGADLSQALRSRPRNEHGGVARPTHGGEPLRKVAVLWGGQAKAFAFRSDADRMMAVSADPLVGPAVFPSLIRPLLLFVSRFTLALNLAFLTDRSCLGGLALSAGSSGRDGGRLEAARYRARRNCFEMLRAGLLTFHFSPFTNHFPFSLLTNHFSLLAAAQAA